MPVSIYKVTLGGLGNAARIDSKGDVNRPYERNRRTLDETGFVTVTDRPSL